MKLKQKSDNMRMTEAGVATYIINKSWLDKYKKYCFYSDAKYSSRPSAASENHLEEYNPGTILNEEILHTEDKYLKGTGKVKDFESEVYDTFLHKDKREKMHYEFLSADLWDFLKTRYSCDHAIKRYYTKGSGYYSLTQVESRFKMIPCFIVRSTDLYQDNLKDQFVVKYMQMSSKKTFSDFKKRVVDVLEAQSMGEIKPERIRLWRCENKANLFKSFEQICKVGEKMETDGA